MTDTINAFLTGDICRDNFSALEGTLYSGEYKQ